MSINEHVNELQRLKPEIWNNDDLESIARAALCDLIDELLETAARFQEPKDETVTLEFIGTQQVQFKQAETGEWLNSLFQYIQQGTVFRVVQPETIFGFYEAYPGDAHIFEAVQDVYQIAPTIESHHNPIPNWKVIAKPIQ